MYYRPDLPATLPDFTGADESFDLYYRTENVVVIYGNARRLHADEFVHAGKLLRLLDSLGKEGIPIRGMIAGRRLMDRLSLRGLNLYLQYGNGLDAFRRTQARFYPWDKYGWRDLQELANLTWK